MAKVLGEAGRYVSQAASKKWRKMLVVALVTIGAVAWLGGFLFGYLFQKTLWWASLIVNGIAVGLVLLIRKWAYDKIDVLHKQREDLRKGARGEVAVGLILADFPDTFCVINDLATKFGNIDHVVVGPTGVFALDTKNWRGIIAPDGKGELQLNNRPSDNGKTHIKTFVRRVMEVREKLKTLAPEFDPYIQGVFVFTSAFVDAEWGKTGSVHCMRDDQIHDYIVESKRSNKLNKEQVKKLAGAFAALARMDIDFADKANPAKKPISNFTY